VPDKRISDRERRRLQTRRARHGADFDKINARRAGMNSPTKFNSQTGRDAAKLKWKKYRAEKAKKLREAQQNGSENDGR
jgi:hypothetical protein